MACAVIIAEMVEFSLFLTQQFLKFTSVQVKVIWGQFPFGGGGDGQGIPEGAVKNN